MDDLQNPATGARPLDNATRDYIAARVKQGASREAIVQELIQRGYDPATARDMVGGVARKHARSARQNGLLYLIAGILITAISLAATIGSYQNAAERGGTYYVCCGLTLFGIVLAVRGAMQLIGGREVK